MRGNDFIAWPYDLALFTDLYELSMLQSYFEAGLSQEAVFSLFIRRLPKERNYFLVCGLADMLQGLEVFRFSQDAIQYLSSLNKFSSQFLDYLAEFRFEGDVHAAPEGTPIFANEPILEVVAPIGQGQLIETFVMNQLHLQTLLASKAARVVEAAQGRAVVDFGARRMHGLDAAVKAARAFHIAGVDATSNVLAGKRYGIPVAGTMAHSYIEAFDTEYEAFHTFSETFPETILLVDTYDTIAGVKNVIRLARELGKVFRINGIRLDSGNLASLAKECRKELDKEGLESVKIFVSGGIDEYEIRDLLANGAPISGFGVGTAMGVSDDVPALDIAYKICAYDGKGRLKLSTGKQTYPGRKQVFRVEEGRKAIRDVIARAEEDLAGGRPLLKQVMKRGKIVPDLPKDPSEIREYARHEIEKLPGNIRRIETATNPYPILISDELETHRREVTLKITQNQTIRVPL